MAGAEPDLCISSWQECDGALKLIDEFACSRERSSGSTRGQVGNGDEFTLVVPESAGFSHKRGSGQRARSSSRLSS